jgi:UDP-N-acetylmuramate: L-alanyl-gamma-D-glutamyl-meso-diaminopimelate ligase
VVLVSVFRPEAVPEGERLLTSNVIAGVNAAGKRGRELADADAIVKTIAPELRDGDVVAILSNGGFGGIYEKLPERLRSLRAAIRA